MQKKRALLKQPGLSLRIGFLNAVFPDALFLHMIRDPLANFASLVRVKEASREQFWGIKIPGWRDLMFADKKLQAAIQMQVTLDIIGRDVRRVQALDRYSQVRYESLVSNPRRALAKVLGFCDLAWTDGTEQALHSIQRNPTRSGLQEHIPKEITDILSLVAERYGYSWPRLHTGES
jgi:hypothetical protein